MSKKRKSYSVASWQLTWSDKMTYFQKSSKKTFMQRL